MPQGYVLNLVVVVNNEQTRTALCCASNDAKIDEVKVSVDAAITSGNFRVDQQAIANAVSSAVNGKTAVAPTVEIPFDVDGVFTEVVNLPFAV